jgi:hypothetical protein
LADISKINAVALANIAKLDAVTAANIAKVNGLVFASAPGFVGLLDETYGSGAAAAYSTRRLASATTVLMRVRRETAGGTGDDDEADVAYDTNNELSLDSAISNASAGVTATTLGQFLNVGTVNGTTYTNPDSLTVTASCFVDTWYDQAGSNDAEQTAQGSQPQIHNGTVNTDLITENGKPAVDFDGSDFLDHASDLTLTASSFYSTITASPSTRVWYGKYGPDYLATFSSLVRINAAGKYTDFAQVPGGQSLYSFTRDGVGLGKWGYNGTQQSVTGTMLSDAGTFNSIGGFNPYRHVGNYQELIIYDVDQDTNTSALETDINAHFQIGNFGTPTSGLLFDYPDAAAAYSVRQLANTAPLSMRVRRDTAGGTGDDDEADVLFDFTLTDPTISLDSRINNASTGVASTTLGEFLNATGYTDVDSLGTVADGFCDTWYDQSGNGNNAEQTAFGSQPQIFDSASPTDLITENGKPVLDFSDVSQLTTPFDTSSSAFDLPQTMVLATRFVSGGSFENYNFVVSGGSSQVFGKFEMYSHPADGTYTQLRTGSGSGSAVNVNTSSFTSTDMYLHSGIWGSSNMKMSYNGGSVITGGATNSNDHTNILLALGATSNTISGAFRTPEFIIWPTDQDSDGNLSGINTNINTYFSIY